MITWIKNQLSYCLTLLAKLEFSLNLTLKIKQKDDEINALTDDQKAANAERLSDAPQLESNVN